MLHLIGLERRIDLQGRRFGVVDVKSARERVLDVRETVLEVSASSCAAVELGSRSG